jgi:hypothetical protein
VVHGPPAQASVTAKTVMSRPRMNANIELACAASRRRKHHLTAATATAVAEPDALRNLDEPWLSRDDEDKLPMKEAGNNICVLFTL